MKDCNVVMIRAKGQFEDFCCRHSIFDLHRPLVHDQHGAGRDHKQNGDKLQRHSIRNDDLEVEELEQAAGTLPFPQCVLFC